MQPLPGDRVVVRYRLGAGGPDDWRAAPNPALAHSPSLSDLTGLLVAATPATLVIERDGVAETVPAAAVTSIRLLSRSVVRNSQIRAVLRALTDAAPAMHRADVADWSVSCDPAGDRLWANAAVPLGFAASAAGLGAVRAWYAERGAPGRVIVPERLLRPADVAAALAPGADSADIESAGIESGGVEYEVLVDTAGRPAAVPGDDLAARRRLREQGYGLHHTFRVLPLS